MRSSSRSKLIFHKKYLIYEVQNKQLDNRSLGKTNIKRYTISCRIELDIRHGAAENAVESNSTSYY